MKKKILRTLSEEEYRLVRKTKRKNLAELDEDALIKLHTRTQRARNKHVKNYRQAGAAKVQSKGSRGAARPANSHNAARAEVFEKALARVSRQLGVVAARSAADLKDSRLAKAKGKSKGREGKNPELTPPWSAVRARSSRRAETASMRPVNRPAARNKRPRRRPQVSAGR